MTDNPQMSPPGAPPPQIQPRPIPLERIRLAEDGAPRWLLWFCVAVAVLLAWATVRDRIGLGTTVGGLAVLAVALWRTRRSLPIQRGALALVTAALWTVPTWRDAGWVVALTILAAVFSTWFVVAMPTRLSSLPILMLKPLLEIPAGAEWAGSRTRRVDRDVAVRVVRAVLLSIGLAVLFGGLFAAADPAFGEVVIWLIDGVSLLSLGRLLAAGMLLAIILGLVHWAGAKPNVDGTWPKRPAPVGRLDWLLPLTVVNAVFALFIVLQARTLFGGEDYVMDTAGLTYAQHARSGFWQLSIISVLSLAVIAVAAWRAPRTTGNDRWVLRIALGALSLMSLVVVASALSRMDLYSQAYGLTRLRVWVFAVEVWLGVLFCLVLFCGIRLRAGWLARAAVGTGAAVIVALAAINPEALIARQNLERFETTGDMDYYYLAGLSPDAVAEVAEQLDGHKRDCLINRILAELDTEDDLLAWNSARAAALEQMRDSPSEHCSLRG